MIPGIASEFITNLKKIIQKNSPDKKTVWDKEEVEEYVKIVLDELLMRDDIVQIILHGASMYAYQAASLSSIKSKVKWKKFSCSADQLMKKYDKRISKLGELVQLKVT